VRDESDIKQSKNFHFELLSTVFMPGTNVTQNRDVTCMHGCPSTAHVQQRQYEIRIDAATTMECRPDPEREIAVARMAKGVIACLSLSKVTISLPVSAPHRWTLEAQDKTIGDINSRHYPLVLQCH
jgi:hypothetical protein